MRFYGLIASSLLMLAGCSSKPVQFERDRPLLVPEVKLQEHTLHSAALARDMAVRFIVPAQTRPQETLPVVYLLHGAGVNYHDWTNNSQIAEFAAKGIVLVLPDMPNSYYINQQNGLDQKYEDYFVNELIPEVHRSIPYAATDKFHTAIVGISRGGYGAAVLALRHPQLFGFAGLISPAIDLAERRFRWRAPIESLQLNRIFGSAGSQTRRNNDPFLLAKTVNRSEVPWFFIACGDHDVLLDATARFASLLRAEGLPSQFLIVRGSHNWSAWNQAIQVMEPRLTDYFYDPTKFRNQKS